MQAPPDPPTGLVSPQSCSFSVSSILPSDSTSVVTSKERNDSQYQHAQPDESTSCRVSEVTTGSVANHTTESAHPMSILRKSPSVRAGGKTVQFINVSPGSREYNVRPRNLTRSVSTDEDWRRGYWPSETMKKGGLEVFGRYKKLIQYLVSDCVEKATPLTTNANRRYPVEMTQIVQELRTVMGSFFRTEEENEMSRNSCEIVKFIRELADTSNSGLTQAIMRDPEGACTLQSKLKQQVDTPTAKIEPLLLLEPLPVLPPFQPGAALEKLAPIEMVHIMGPTQQLQWFGFGGRAGEETTLMESHDKDCELLIKDLGWRILKIADGQVLFFPQRYIEPVILISAAGTPAVALNMSKEVLERTIDLGTGNSFKRLDPK